MTLFQLFVYSCVTLNAPIGGDLLQKTCQWGNGITGFYARKESCEADAPAVGSPIFSDVVDGRKVELTKCDPITLNIKR